MKIFLVVAALGLTACASLGTVTPQPNNMAQVVGQGASEQDAIKQANATAKKHCTSKQKSYAVIESKTAYKGLVSEKANKVLDTVIGVPFISSDTDYTVTMSVQCE